MDIVFNELSLLDVPSCKFDGTKMIELFIRCYSKLVSEDYGLSRDIVTSTDLNSIEIAQGYYISQWRNDPSIDIDIVRQFKRMCDRQQLCGWDNDDYEILFNNQTSTGFSIAYSINGVLLSLKSGLKWNDFEISCQKYTLENDDIEDVKLYNFCDDEQIIIHKKELEQLKNFSLCSINNSQSFLNQKESIFPSLIFHKTAISQIKNNVQRQHFPALVKKLLLLEEYFARWDGTVFDENAFANKSVSTESKETLKMYQKEHTFIFDEELNLTIVVSYHIRYTGNIPGRIYFYPDHSSKKCLICSLTTKLPTVSEHKSKV